MLAALFFAVLIAQTEPLVRTSASEVVVDVVARDKKGKLVRGLTAADLSVLEDGKVQSVTSVREIATGIAEPSPAPGSPAPGSSVRPPAVDATKQPRLFTLVFDRLGIDSRRLARQAAHDLIKEDLGPNVYLAVFFTDLHLKVIQPFTNDRTKLGAAIDQATSGAPTDYANAAFDLQLAAASTRGSEGSAEAAASGGSQNVDGGGIAAEAMSRMINDMLEFTETSTREQQGRSSIFALWGIVKEQHRLPGRKTLLYFSEGIQVPNSLQNQFRNMVSAANRSNVSIYAVDARGLSVANDNQPGQDLMNRNLKVSQGQYRSSQSAQSEAVTREQAMQFDRAEDAIRANPQIALAELAESTGGFLIANTNDFRQPLRRLTEELGTYYEIVYRPANTNLDGRFRSIEVKVARPDVKLQSRSGYFALPALDGQTVFPYEVPLLNALGTHPLPKGLDYRASVIPFRPVRGAQQSSLIFDLPMRDVTFRENATKTAYRTHFSFLALLKDEQGRVVGKISRDLPMEEPLDKLAGFQAGRAIFSKQLTLRPGRYTLESAVADQEGNRIAARRASLIVPAQPIGRVALSGIAMIRRTDKAPASPEPDDPFIVGANRIIPMLHSTVPGGAQRTLSLYFVVYPAAAPDSAPAEAPILAVEFLRDGVGVGTAAPELPVPLPDGRIPYIANTPLDAFAPGLYEVRVTVRQYGTSARQSIFVTIE